MEPSPSAFPGGVPPRDALLRVIRDLSFARSLERVTEVVRQAARELTGADGVTFVLRDGDLCHYVDEDAVAPLWKGRRFAMDECISGWVMASAEAVVIEDVFADPRVPHEVYRQTFVRSLAMVPVRAEEPIGAIGAYWASHHRASGDELEVLWVLANAAALALANVELFQDLQRSLEREREARRAAEAAARSEERTRLLVEVEERLRQIIDAMADAIVVVDHDGLVKFANPAAEVLFGRPRAEIVGDHFGLPLVAGETVEVDVPRGRVAEMRVVDVAWDGDQAWLASLRDVTARLESEKAARRLWQERTAREEADKERGRLQELLARAPAAILTTRGPDHVCAFANPGMAELVGGRELRGRPLAEALAELGGQGFLEGFESTFTTGHGKSRRELPLVLARRTGSGETKRCLDVTWEPLRSNGGADGVLCFAYDVTEQVGTRRDLERVMERLREEERAKDQFLAVLGHELRNPLAGIDSGLRILEQGGDDERGRWSVGMMRKQVTVLTRLLDDLLDVSAIVRGKVELERQVLAVDELIDCAVAAVQGRFAERGQRLDVSLPRETLDVDGDARRLEQVLANLLVNASKYSPPATTVTLAVRHEGEQVVIEVSDQGSGIEPEMLEQIFEPFVQAGGGTPAAGGLGIGLTLVRQLVELHGGEVVAASPGLGAGSTFTVRLPSVAAAARPAFVPDTDDRQQLRGSRILIVDDNEDAGFALAELLSFSGCTTEVATTGGDGVDKAMAASPDVLLLDLDLPDMTGYEVAARLREQPRLEDLLIVAVSGFGDAEARKRARRSGIDHHLVKPVDLDQLLGLLGRHLNERQAG